MHIFRHIFLSNYWWQKSDIWSQASYRYPISWEVFLNPSDSCFLFADFFDFYTHLTYICICTFFSATIDGRDLIFGHKLDIGTTYRGKRFWTHQIPTSCLPTVDFYTHWTYILYIPIVAFFSATIDDPSDYYFLFAEVRGYQNFHLVLEDVTINRHLFFFGLSVCLHFLHPTE
jgi:hypothetical protein